LSPILGIYASQISGHLWEPSGAYDALWSTTLSASASSITISNIPQDYKHLQIRFLVRSDRAAANSSVMSMQFNSNTGSNYVGHYLYGNGPSATVVSGVDTVSTKTNLSFITASSAATGIFAPGVIDIVDYANTNKNKTVRALGGYDINGVGSQYVMYSSMLWLNTNAISSIRLFDYNAANFVQYTSIALYGIK
jgi:hypothetical protein